MNARVPDSSPSPAILSEQVPLFVSRTLWKKIYKPPPREAPKKDPHADNPWPDSVKALGLVLGLIAGPYSICWYIASNVTVREWLEPYFPSMAPFLRTYFGEPELGAVGYVDTLPSQKTGVEIPNTLDSEPPAKVRREQEEIDKLNRSLIPTRLRVYATGGFNMGQVLDLPGNTPASPKALLDILMQDRSRTLDPTSVSHITLEFADIKDEVDQSTTTDAEESSVMVEVHMPSTSKDLSSSSSDFGDDEPSKLLKWTSVFSAWHHVVMMPEPTDNKNKSSRKDGGSSNNVMSRDELRMSQLEYEIELLQKQLKDHTTMRDLDDIQQELKQSKSELSKLKWKKRLRVFG